LGGKANGSGDNLALIALAVVGRRASSTFRFFVMAGLDPAIHENAESRNQANDNVPKLETAHK
jgi:hypothetical protein